MNRYLQLTIALTAIASTHLYGMDNDPSSHQKQTAQAAAKVAGLATPANAAKTYYSCATTALITNGARNIIQHANGMHVVIPRGPSYDAAAHFAAQRSQTQAPTATSAAPYAESALALTKTHAAAQHHGMTQHYQHPSWDEHYADGNNPAEHPDYIAPPALHPWDNPKHPWYMSSEDVFNKFVEIGRRKDPAVFDETNPAIAEALIHMRAQWCAIGSQSPAPTAPTTTLALATPPPAIASAPLAQPNPLPVRPGHDNHTDTRCERCCLGWQILCDLIIQPYLTSCCRNRQKQQ